QRQREAPLRRAGRRRFGHGLGEVGGEHEGHDDRREARIGPVEGAPGEDAATRGGPAPLQRRGSRGNRHGTILASGCGTAAILRPTRPPAPSGARLGRAFGAEARHAGVDTRETSTFVNGCHHSGPETTPPRDGMPYGDGGPVTSEGDIDGTSEASANNGRIA